MTVKKKFRLERWSELIRRTDDKKCLSVHIRVTHENASNCTRQVKRTDEAVMSADWFYWAFLLWVRVGHVNVCHNRANKASIYFAGFWRQCVPSHAKRC